MAGVEIAVTVQGGTAGDFSLSDDENDGELELQTRHRQGACLPCQMNDNPYNIPCVECVGNIARKDPAGPKALAIGNLCNCTVVLAYKGSKNHDNEL